MTRENECHHEWKILKEEFVIWGRKLIMRCENCGDVKWVDEMNNLIREI